MKVDATFVLAHAVHFGIVLLIASLVPLYTIEIDNPTHQGVCEAKSKYKVECLAFQGRALNYEGNTVCTGSCTSVITRANSGECEPQDEQNDCTGWMGISNDLLLFSEQATAFCIVIFVFSGIFFTFLCAAFVTQRHAGSFMSAAAFIMLVAALAGAVPLIYTLAMITEYAEVKNANNVGQQVEMSASAPIISLLPITTLLLLQGVSLFATDKNS